MRPDQLTADDLWDILGEYAYEVGEANGVLFSDNEWVRLAWARHQDARGSDDQEEAEAWLAGR